MRNLRVHAKIFTYNPPKIVNIPDILGDMNESAIDSALIFKLNNQIFSLEAIKLQEGHFYIIFHDQSCGNGSYPSGRFLVTEQPKDDSLIIDFNKTYNPPCAFTPYATCPLPPKENYLNISIPAGERYETQKRQESILNNI